MTELVQASLRFPSVVFTIALGIALVYWLFVLIGALDLDLLGGGHGDIDVGGGHDIGGGGHDVDGDADLDGAGVWASLGLGVVPLTISLSVIIIVAWCASLLSMAYIVPDSATWLRYLLFPAVLLVAFPIAGLLVRPLAPIFKIKEGKFNADYVGSQCTVTTATVDNAFGFANIEDGHSLVQISVRCDKTGLRTGDMALIIEFDPAKRTFIVEPLADVLPAQGEEEKSNG